MRQRDVFSLSTPSEYISGGSVGQDGFSGDPLQGATSWERLKWGGSRLDRSAAYVWCGVRKREVLPVGVLLIHSRQQSRHGVGWWAISPVSFGGANRTNWLRSGRANEMLTSRRPTEVFLSRSLSRWESRIRAAMIGGFGEQA